MMMAGVPPQALMEFMTQQAAAGEGMQTQMQQQQQQQKQKREEVDIMPKKTSDDEAGARVKEEQDAMETEDQDQSIVNVQDGARDDAKPTLAAEVPEAKGKVEVAAS